MYFYLSVGSNIHPEINVGRSLEALLIRFPILALYPCVYTQPELIDSRQLFVNTLLIIRSQASAGELKQELNRIETELGRNRDDPERSIKDRPCDIDIQLSSSQFDPELLQQLEEPYLKSVLNYEYSPLVDVRIFGQRLPQRPAAVHLDRFAGNKAVVIQELDSLVDR